MPRAIAFRLYVAWDGSNYINESARLVQATGENRLTSPDQVGSGRGIVDRCNLELANQDGRFSPLNTGSPLYGSLQNGGAYHRPMYLEVSIDGGGTYARVFSGVVKLPQERTANQNGTAAVQIECRSHDELLLGRRMSTTSANLRAINAAGYTEADIIADWLTQAGKSGVIDDGLFVIPWAWMDDESVLEELWQLAFACGGRFYCDPDGVFRYEDATHWLKAPHTTSQETLSRSTFFSLEPVYADNELYSNISVEASARQRGANALLWEPDEPVVVPPNSSKSITARLRQPAYSIDAPNFAAATAGGNSITGNVSVAVVTANAQRIELNVTNTHATEAAYLHPFSITGVNLLGGPTLEETRDSATHGSNGAWWAARGTRSKTVRGNPYIQTGAHAATLATFLLQRSERPRLTYKLGRCAGKPSRRCGDRVTLSDPTIMSSDRAAFITGISWRLTSNGFSQDIEAIDAAGLYPYETEGYFVLGTHTLGAATKPIFY
jgi:hypothetical protein